MKVKLDSGAKAPTRAHSTDAGLDLYAVNDGYVYAHSVRVFDTGTHVQLPENTFGLIACKSGLNINHGIICSGVVDEGYTGAIKVALHNTSHSEYHVHKGDKIAELIVIPCRYEDVEIVNEIDGGERGDNGFGSSGR